MGIPKTSRITGFLRYSLAHHPVCWQFRDHLIRVGGWSLCLGCTGFYGGFIAGIGLIVFGGLSTFSWFELIVLAFILWIPTLLRLGNLMFFNTARKGYKFVFRVLLGVGIAVGVYSIFIAPSLIIQITQILIGILFYSGLTINRIRKGPQEWDRLCEACTFTRNNYCPGLKPLLIWRM